MFVYVISKDGQPLMPTIRFGKVRRLLRDKKAKVVRRCPFTIKLLYEPENLVVQEVVLGQDTGSKYVGTACVADDKVLYQSEITLRDDIKKKMDRRRVSLPPDEEAEIPPHCSSITSAPAYLDAIFAALVDGLSINAQ